MERAIYDRMREVEDRHWWFLARRDIVRHAIQSLRLPRPARIFEAGCGTGGNLPLLASFGPVTALELDDSAMRMAQARGMAKVVAGHLPDGLPVMEQRFDLVVMLDVLEHIDHDLEALRSLKPLLAPGGTLLLTVPALPMLWSSHDEKHHHKRRYLRSQLMRVIQDAGFSVRYVTYYNTILFPLIALCRMLGRWSRHSASEDPLRLPGPRVNGLLHKLFGLERYVVPKVRLPFGVSLLALAQ